jgi:hypothetical protein
MMFQKAGYKRHEKRSHRDWNMKKKKEKKNKLAVLWRQETDRIDLSLKTTRAHNKGDGRPSSNSIVV